MISTSEEKIFKKPLIKFTVFKMFSLLYQPTMQVMPKIKKTNYKTFLISYVKNVLYSNYLS